MDGHSLAYYLIYTARRQLGDRVIPPDDIEAALADEEEISGIATKLLASPTGKCIRLAAAQIDDADEEAIRQFVKPIFNL